MYILVSVEVSAAIGCLGCFILSCTSSMKIKMLFGDSGWLNRFLKQDLHLGNVENTEETLSKFQWIFIYLFSCQVCLIGLPARMI
jgi:hypothetical protein